MKKISTRRITVITSPEDSAEFRRGGKPNSKFDTRSPLVLLFYLIGRKKSSFPSGGTNPLFFSRNSPKGHIKEPKAEEEKKGAPLAFFLVPATLKPAVPIFPLGLCLSRLFESLLYLSSTIFPDTPNAFLSSFGSWSISCSPWSSAGIFSRLLSFIPSRNFFSRNSPFSSGLFSWRTARLRFRVFDYLVYFLEFFPFFPSIGFCFSFDHCSKACVILEVRS